MHSRCFGIIEGHGNFAFNLVIKCVELCFSNFEVINASMSSALLSVLLVCSRRIREKLNFKNEDTICMLVFSSLKYF
jgi:hypothetical protein